jgi:hypothetical protein
VLKTDVEAALSGAATGTTGGDFIRPKAAPALVTPAGPNDTKTPYRGLRRAIGDQMVRSLYTAPHFTLVDEIDFTEIDNLRKAGKDDAATRGTKLTYLPFVMKALCAVAKKHPTINGALDEANAEFILRGDVHIGFALDTDRGLMVPGGEERVAARRARHGRGNLAPVGTRPHGQGRARRPDGFDDHDHVRRLDRRIVRDADHQLPRSGHPRPLQGGEIGPSSSTARS